MTEPGTAGASGGKAPARAGRANCFDFLRLFAAATVVVQHGFEHLQRPFLWADRDHGWWFRDGVALFFVMSGMLVYRSCARCVETGRPLRQYFINRFLRVAPLIYLYSIVTPLFLIAIGALSVHSLFSRGMLAWFASNLVLVPVAHPQAFRSIGVGVINGSLWTIPAEVSFYLICPGLVWIDRKIGRRALVATVVSLAVAGTLLRWGFETYAEEAPIFKALSLTFLPHFLFFGLGILFSLYWQRLPQSLPFALICAVVYLAIRYDIGGARALVPMPIWRIVWGVPMAYAFVYLGYYGPKILVRIPEKIGDLSYGVYVWHMVVINVFLYLGVRERMAGSFQSALILALLAVTFALALASWWTVERTALRFKPFSTRAG
jgi:peptidoglycan/LPS O-acetylase OafA/YrhL